MASATIYRERTGGSLRTFSGGLSHENGWWPSYKRQRLQHWQGEAQLDYLQLCEASHRALWAQSEAVRVEFNLDGPRSTTVDLEVAEEDGGILLVELKRDEDDLRHDDLLRTYACAAEIFRRVGWRYEIVFEHDIHENRHHRANCALFASRRFASVGRHHLDRLRAHRARYGLQSTYGDLAGSLDPARPAAGEAVLQALVVRRAVRMDLVQRLTDGSPVEIR